ncbi:hypothetical protein ADL27_32520 [Streptomyces sp. NRRL F-6602]|nr:hypothetical protein ADL27_32520 [Streptomyces sp. NRRL F-6602]
MKTEWKYGSEWITWLHYPDSPNGTAVPGIAGPSDIEGRCFLTVGKPVEGEGFQSVKHENLHGLEFPSGREAFNFAVRMGLIVSKENEKEGERVNVALAELTGESPETRAVLRYLSTEARMHVTVADSLPLDSVEEFMRSAKVTLGDITEVTKRELDGADWPYIFRTVKEQREA